ncbi:MAG: GNAT family N-acetyltransferase [Gemmatimonadota bacterium]
MSSDALLNPVIRPATSADLPRLGRLGALLVETHHAFDSRRFLAARDRTPADYAGFLVRQLGDPRVVILVADDHGDVIGYSYGAIEGYDYMALRGPAGVLYDIVVESGYRGRGVGRLLLETTLAELESRGAPRVVLTRAERNEVAQRLFERAGFRRTMIEMTRESGDAST